MARPRGPVRAARHDEPFDDEIQEHLRLLADRFVAQGMSREESALAARLQTLGIPIARGREFNAGDTADAPKVAMINETLAKREFGNQDPIGRTIIAGYDEEGPMTIVGIIGDVTQHHPTQPPNAEVVMPYEQHFRSTGTALRVLVRTQAPPETLEKRRGPRCAPARPPCRCVSARWSRR